MKQSILVLVCLVLAAVTLAVSAQAGDTYTVKVRHARVREAPDTSSAIVITLPKRTLVTVQEVVTGTRVAGSTTWYQLVGEGYAGYIHSSLVTRSGGSPATPTPTVVVSTFPYSPDGRYMAQLVNHGDGNIDYEVIVVATGLSIFTTEAQFGTPNDIKAVAFSTDSSLFAGAYHYGQGYTWIGIWSTQSGEQVSTITVPGQIRNLESALGPAFATR
jgi:hypothetical protein